MPANHQRINAFTLIELLVVISIIALLIGILLPALGSARGEARAIRCAAGMRQVAIAMNTYNVESKGFFPPSYVYPATGWNGTGTADTKWEWVDQGVGSSNDARGYLHWSYVLFAGSGGNLGLEAFQCPEIDNGGHPATNVRDGVSTPTDYTPGSAGTVDRQVDYVAFAANEILIPRNKFFGGTPANRLVRDAEVADLSSTIMVTEFVANYKGVADGGGVSKSHRSINPVFDASAGYPDSAVQHNINPTNGVLWAGNSDFGLADQETHTNPGLGALKGANQIGRHHPGGDEFGGTANFTRADGSTFRDTVYNSILDQQWGSKFFSLTGAPKITYVNWP